MGLERKFKHLLLSLLPPGKFWNIEPESTFDRILNGISQSFAYTQSDINSLLDYLAIPEDPRFIEPWESLLALEPIDGNTLNDRVERARFWLSPPQSLSQESFESYLNIEGFKSFQIDDTTQDGGLIVGGGTSNNTFTITLTTDEFSYFEAGSSCVGEALVEWKNERFEKLVNRVKPAHVKALIEYKKVE